MSGDSRGPNVPRARARQTLGLEYFTQRVQRREGSWVSEEHCVRDDSGLAGTWEPKAMLGMPAAGSRRSVLPPRSLRARLS